MITFADEQDVIDAINLLKRAYLHLCHEENLFYDTWQWDANLDARKIILRCYRSTITELAVNEKY